VCVCVGVRVGVRAACGRWSVIYVCGLWTVDCGLWSVVCGLWSVSSACVLLLQVGDYVLSSKTCVERKSIPDLIGSFASGRLFTQMEIMSKFYDVPALLIEFAEDKVFSLQPVSDIGSEIANNNIISKLVLLVLHFPQMRILWSRSPTATVDLFLTVKEKQVSHLH
jgi:ERCC4-type nuclease